MSTRSTRVRAALTAAVLTLIVAAVGGLVTLAVMLHG